uniref:Toxin higB-2 n=1 Tax=mine drainage metagenome TaxID=410659 RepID=E6QTZ6_9ZZZZ
MPPFERHRQNYLNDENFNSLQKVLMDNPEAGDVIEGTGGLRKIRYADEKRGKGKRGGLRVIYFWWQSGKQFWLFTLYNKNEMDDLTAAQHKILKEFLKLELDARRWEINETRSV